MKKNPQKFYTEISNPALAGDCTYFLLYYLNRCDCLMSTGGTGEKCNVNVPEKSSRLSRNRTTPWRSGEEKICVFFAMKLPRGLEMYICLINKLPAERSLLHSSCEQNKKTDRENRAKINTSCILDNDVLHVLIKSFRIIIRVVIAMMSFVSVLQRDNVPNRTRRNGITFSRLSRRYGWASISVPTHSKYTRSLCNQGTGRGTHKNRAQSQGRGKTLSLIHI